MIEAPCRPPLNGHDNARAAQRFMRVSSPDAPTIALLIGTLGLLGLIIYAAARLL